MVSKKNIVFLQVILLAMFSLSIKAEDVTDAQKELLSKLPADQRDSILEKMTSANKLQDEINEVFDSESTLIERPELETKEPEEDCRIVFMATTFLNTHLPHSFKQVRHRYHLIMS